MDDVNHSNGSAPIVRGDNANISHKVENYSHLVKDAATADASEHTMSVREAFRIHKKAVFWSMALSGESGCVLEKTARIRAHRSSFQLHWLWKVTMLSS